jgi:hypothetical protein
MDALHEALFGELEQPIFFYEREVSASPLPAIGTT